MQNTKRAVIKRIRTIEPKTLSWLSPLASWFLIILTVLALQFFPLSPHVEKMHALVESSGPLGPLVFITLFTVSVIFAPVPQGPLVLLSGMFFHPLIATILVVVGATAGGSVNFLIGKVVIARVRRGKVPYVQTSSMAGYLARWPTVFLVRLLAGFSFDWYSYLLGAIGTPWKTFLSATILGIIPGTYAQVVSGSLLIDNPLGALLVAGILTLIGMVALRWTSLGRFSGSASEIPSTLSTPSPTDDDE